MSGSTFPKVIHSITHGVGTSGLPTFRPRYLARAQVPRRGSGQKNTESWWSLRYPIPLILLCQQSAPFSNSQFFLNLLRDLTHCHQPPGLLSRNSQKGRSWNRQLDEAVRESSSVSWHSQSASITPITAFSTDGVKELDSICLALLSSLVFLLFYFTFWFGKCCQTGTEQSFNTRVVILKLLNGILERSRMHVSWPF